MYQFQKALKSEIYALYQHQNAFEFVDAAHKTSTSFHLPHPNSQLARHACSGNMYPRASKR